MKEAQMKKFLVTMTETTEVEVEIDPAEMTEEWMAEFNECFFKLETIKEHAERIGLVVARRLEGETGFIEGYGHVRIGNRFKKINYSDYALRHPGEISMNISAQRLAPSYGVEVEEK